MSNTYPYYTEPTHEQGAVITLAAANAGRTTATSSTEQRLIVDAVDKIFLLEPNKHPLVTLLTNVGKVYDKPILSYKNSVNSVKLLFN